MPQAMTFVVGRVEAEARQSDATFDRRRVPLAVKKAPYPAILI